MYKIWGYWIGSTWKMSREIEFFTKVVFEFLKVRRIFGPDNFYFSCFQITNKGVLSLEKGLKEMKKDLFEVSLYFSLCKNVSSEVKKNLLAELKDQYPLGKISGSE